jgi:predicted DNA-binding transcriptional regulator YafY
MTIASRVTRIHALLRSHKHGVPTSKFLEELGVSRATFFRDIAVLRDQMRQPIAYDKAREVWHLDEKSDPAVVRTELPGIWITAEESYALLTLQNVLKNLDPGFLNEYVTPLRPLLRRIVQEQIDSTAGISRKVSVEIGQFAKVMPAVFSRIAEALIRERRLRISLSAGDRTKTFEVFPHKLVLTPNGWQLEVLNVKNHESSTIPIAEILRVKIVSDASRGNHHV